MNQANGKLNNDNTRKHVAPKKCPLQGDGVGIKIYAADLGWWVIHIKEARVYSNEIRKWRIQDIAEPKWAQWYVRTLPLEREYALQREQ